MLAGLAGCQRDRPAPVVVASADSVLRAPDGSSVPAGALGRSVLRGEAIFEATRDSLPGHVGNALRCASCHLIGGRDPGVLSLTGSFARYPQYRSRGAAVQTIEDRINSCLERSLDGHALDPADTSLRDLVVYLAFISRGVPVGSAPTRLPPMATQGDTGSGAAVYARTCARCHGDHGQGNGPYPPLWGDQSFTIGAGMARTATAAAFIHARMPFDQPGTVDSADAVTVAAYISSRPRPDFAGKEHDWPLGGAPADVPYATAHAPH